MGYSVGDKLRIEGADYAVIGKIKYKNRNDGLTWFEYRITNTKTRQEKWLSYDESYKEYSLSQITRGVDTTGYHVVDRGVQEVLGAWGNVDVECGDRASFVEYEDANEDNIISLETWEDGEETSMGYYIEEEQVKLIASNPSNNRSGNSSSGNKKSKTGVFLTMVFVLIFLSPFIMCIALSMSENAAKKTMIRDYLNKNTTRFEYKTSITGSNGEKADVYKTESTTDKVATLIIAAIKGDVVNVSQNKEDNDSSITILTKYEYCLIYVSEDNEVLIQVSSRKYAYSNNSSPYRSHNSTGRFYRRYYYSRGYQSDQKTYKDVRSPYDDFDDTSLASTSTSDKYNTYASSVRQESVKARSSSGGGTSSGK